MKHVKSLGQKKGQIAGQIFIYIMAIIIIGTIIIIGAKAIIGVGEKTCNAEKLNFKTDIESKIEEKNSFGSVTTKAFRAPCDYDSVCFVDRSYIGDNEFRCERSKIIEDSVIAGVRDNIFVMSNKNTISIGYSDLVGLNPGPSGEKKCLCIDKLNGNFNIRFSGRGATTEISNGAE